MSPHRNEGHIGKQQVGEANLSALRYPLRLINVDPERLLQRGHTTEACASLHHVVLEFREAHGIEPEGSSRARQEAISRYPLEKAAPSERAAIQSLSTPSEYANLRQGGRAHSPYPPLSEELLEDLCKEISAALVWRILVVQGRSSAN